MLLAELDAPRLSLFAKERLSLFETTHKKSPFQCGIDYGRMQCCANLRTNSAFGRGCLLQAQVATLDGELAPLAQLDRASVYGTEGYWFESSGVYS